MSATLVQMNVEGYPEIRIEDRDDALTLTRILNRNGIAVNLRNVSDWSRQSEDG